MTVVNWLACGEDEPPDSDHWLSARDRSRLAAMTYTKRYEEARLSRWTAHRAVALTVGLDDTVDELGLVEISNAPDGSPRASAPGAEALSISSTDRAGWAVTAVVEGQQPIGCDLEIVEPRSPAFVRDYFTQSEQRFVEQGPLGRDVAANLIWSAKESALKVLRTGLRRDTRTVEVRLEEGLEGAWTSLTVVSQSAGPFAGWWRRFGPFLLTVASTVDLAPPISLVEPSPLDTAEPVHSWVTSPTRRPAEPR